MYKVEVNFPNLSKGQSVELDGLGIFKNGSSRIVTDEEAKNFRTKHGVYDIVEHKDGGREVNVETGPTVLQAFENNEYVVVTVHEEKQEDKAPVVSDNKGTGSPDNEEKK